MHAIFVEYFRFVPASIYGLVSVQIVSVYFRNLQFLLWQIENTHFISIGNAIGWAPKSDRDMPGDRGESESTGKNIK